MAGTGKVGQPKDRRAPLTAAQRAKNYRERQKARMADRESAAEFGVWREKLESKGVAYKSIVDILSRAERVLAEPEAIGSPAEWGTLGWVQRQNRMLRAEVSALKRRIRILEGVK